MVFLVLAAQYEDESLLILAGTTATPIALFGAAFAPQSHSLH